MNLYKTLMQERSHLAPVVESLTELKDLEKQAEDSREMIKAESDAELVEMAKEELQNLEEEIKAKEKECRILLIPPDPLEGKNIIMEIRAGTGGDEASLFAADIFRMYSHYAEKQHWKILIPYIYFRRFGLISYSYYRSIQMGIMQNYAWTCLE